MGSKVSYIIENVSLLKADSVEKTSLLINQDRIEFMRPSMKNFRFMRMDMSTYLLTPGYVMLDFSLHTLLHFQEFKQYMIQHYLKKGCTSLLTVVDVQGERDLATKLKEKRHQMINTPIDYYIGIKLPLHSLTPAILRKCKQQNVSVVFIEADKEDTFKAISWGWIRDAMFSNPITLILYPPKDSHKNQKILHLWEKIMKENRLSSISTPLEEKAPLSKNVLMRLGIYPVKGDIRVGGQVNYNLYNLDDLRYHTNGMPKIQYDEQVPTFTAHQGKLINVKGDITFNPGVGEESFISISGRFIPQSASF